MAKKDDILPRLFSRHEIQRLCDLTTYLERREGSVVVWLDLPWPEKTLSPNAAVHFRTRAQAILRNKLACRQSVLEQLQHPEISQAVREIVQAKAPIWVGLLYSAPDRRKRDLDNLIARCKSSLDAVADCLGFNDSQISVICARLAQATTPGGIVRIAISLANNDGSEDPDA